MACTIEKQVLLAPHTTFGIGGHAEFFVLVEDMETLEEAVIWAEENKHSATVLGGGSNILVSDEGVRGLVIKNEIKDISYTEEGDTVFAHAGGGVTFDTLVDKCVSQGLWGLENLSAIPGTVGAAPIQNIGAYGVEVSSCIESVVAYDIKNKKEKVFTNKECNFAYRHSFFKTEAGKKYIVTNVTFRLSKVGTPDCSYKDLEKYFAGSEPSLQQVRSAVVEIRSHKFPDWKEEGTAGSFFKNPIISKEEYEHLLRIYPELPGFPVKDGGIKVPLGWILDKGLGLKGVTNTSGGVGTYKEQALVVVNKNSATAEEINSFANDIEQKVFKVTGIVIEREVTNVA